MNIFKIVLFTTGVSLCQFSHRAFAQEQERAMTFLDVIQMRHAGPGVMSPDGKWFGYTISVPDWEQNKTFSDIYITPLAGGKTKQLTFTKDKNESSLKWYKDGSFFAFLSENSEYNNQIYFMHLEGDEAWQVTDDEFGVSSYQWSRDWKYLAYLGGSHAERQIWITPGKGGAAEKLTDHKTAISSYFWSPNSKKIYFVAPDDVNSPSHLWQIDIETKQERRLTAGDEYSVLQSVISENGTKIAFFGSPTGSDPRAFGFESDVYLLDLNTNIISRITNNSYYGRDLSFSPDSKWLAFTKRDEWEISFKVRKIYIVPSEGGEVRQLLTDFDYEGWISFWSDDSRDIYFSAGVGVNIHLFKVPIDNSQIEQITTFGGYPFFVKDKDTGTFLVWHFDSENPRDVYYSVLEHLADKDKWIKLTDANPQIKDFLLGKYETIRWKSTDDTPVEGLLIKPVNYNKDRKYPLIVQIHGGPHGVSGNVFSDSRDYVHIYAANDYVVFQPNYRGSVGYGEKFKKDVTPYFGLSLDDIMTGVDHLIERGIVHPDSMGVMGWSAGGDYSNAILVSTDRFKAISTGAGTVDLENYAKESPLEYIENAKTPTLIHFGENDPIVPPRQGEILYTALKELGVPTEFIVYPNTGHGISDMRYQMDKMQAEFNWFEKWIRGRGRMD